MSWTRSASSRKSSDGKPFISEKARQRPVRVLPPDDSAEFEAGHLIPRRDPMEEANAAYEQPVARDEFSSEPDGAEASQEHTSTGFSGSSFTAAADNETSF